MVVVFKRLKNLWGDRASLEKIVHPEQDVKLRATSTSYSISASWPSLMLLLPRFPCCDGCYLFKLETKSTLLLLLSLLVGYFVTVRGETTNMDVQL